MIRSTALASLTILAAVAAAPTVQAQGVTGITGYVPPHAGNVVGGASAVILGGGDDMVVLYNLGGAGAGSGSYQAGRLARFAGADGDGPHFDYAAGASEGGGREAWLIGGGDANTEVVYSSPMPPRR